MDDDDTTTTAAMTIGRLRATTQTTRVARQCLGLSSRNCDHDKVKRATVSTTPSVKPRDHPEGVNMKLSDGLIRGDVALVKLQSELLV